MFNGDLLYNLHTLDCLVYEVQNISVDLAKLETLETVYIMEEFHMYVRHNVLVLNSTMYIPST